jgi:hypothetical protein
MNDENYDYCPDKWVILRMTNKKEIVYKVLAGWSGGYLYGQSWKLNSGITKIEDEVTYYLFHGYTTSVYKCFKTSYGLNSITIGVLESFMKQAEGIEGVKIECLSFAEVLEWLTERS